MFDRIREDVAAMADRDPAARGSLGVFLTYPGLHAVWAHVYLAAPLYAVWPLGGKLLAYWVRAFTGVEIHPDADIGRRVTIDHGDGVVIGETAEVGDDVHMYHGVTLGGNDPRPVERHPTVREGAVLGANATLLGDIEVGEGASVGAGSVVTSDVPAGATVAGIPAERIEDGESAGDSSPNTGEGGDEDEGASDAGRIEADGGDEE